MANVFLIPPRAKRWVNQPKKSPFPVPIASLIGHPPSIDEWSIYEGHLHGNGVIVDDPRHMEALFDMVEDLSNDRARTKYLIHNGYLMGFFGKATFSRSGPSSNKHSDEQLEIMSQRRYESHQSWKALANNKSSTDDDDGGNEQTPQNEVLVVNDTDSESEPMETLAMVKFKTKDPFPLQQKLHLTLEEAFFLSFGLGCLLVTEDNKDWSLGGLNKLIAKIDETGTTLASVLYKDGPPFYHASYSVIVKPVVKDSLNTLPGVTEYPNSWSSLAALNRITEHVVKELLCCYVMQPTDLSPEAMMTPDCISKFQVQELLVRRWVSSEEREAEENI